MKRLLILLPAIALLISLPISVSFGHGGQYRGPGGTNPPLGTDNNQGNSAPTGTLGDSLGPAGPSTASLGGGSRTARKGSAGGLQGKKWAGTQGNDRWEFWWEYNKDTYLSLKNKIFSNRNVVGSGTFLIGRRSKDQYRTSRLATAEIMKTEVVPILLKTLKMDHPDVQDSTVLALSRITKKEDARKVLSHIEELLASRYQTAQQAASLSLGVLGSPDAVPLCRELIFDTPPGQKLVSKSEVPPFVRAFAALSLGLLRAVEGVPDLIRVVERENPMTQKDLISCAVTALGLMGDTKRKDEVLSFLRKKLADPTFDPFLKAQVPVALGRLGDPTALYDVLLVFQEDKQNPWVRRSAAIAVGLLADLEQHPDVPKMLMRYIRKGKDIQSGHLCLIALAQIGARDKDFVAHQALHRQISKFFLTEIDRPSRHSHTPWAALAATLHAMPHRSLQEDVIEKVVKAFRGTRNPSFKSAFAISLGLLNAKGNVDLLYRELCASKDKLLQGYLCVGIGLMRWTGAIDRIRTFAATESSFFLRLQAAVGLGLMGDTRAVGILVRSLQEGQTLCVISSVARALGQIGDVNALGSLEEIIEDSGSSNLSKAFAVVAIGIIGEKTDLPWNTCISENCNYTVCSAALIEALDIL